MLLVVIDTGLLPLRLDFEKYIVDATEDEKDGAPGLDHRELIELASEQSDITESLAID